MSSKIMTMGTDQGHARSKETTTQENNTKLSIKARVSTLMVTLITKYILQFSFMNSMNVHTIL